MLMRRVDTRIATTAIIAAIALTLGARHASAQGDALDCAQNGAPECFPKCAPVLPCPTRSTTCNTTINCSQLNSFTFTANQTVCVNPGSCTIGVITINQPNVLLRGKSPVTVSPAAGGDSFKITADGVGLENFNLRPNGTVRFNDGIMIADGADNVSIRNVMVDGATVNAGISISSSSLGICLEDVFVADARDPNNPQTTSNGFVVRAAGGGGTVDFRGAMAFHNSFDGFAIEQNAGLHSATFFASSGNRVGEV
jgi:hypothetical protein